jgi:NAD-dependent deacetylase
MADAANIVFFGGAGVSTASGIPDYRSKGGLYDAPDALLPEVMLSRSFFFDHPERFYEFYRANMLHLEALPNDAHRALARLEWQGKLGAVVTQNIDGLHQKAGSQRVLELHGSVWRNHCLNCGAPRDAEDIAAGIGVPHCGCGGIIKPDVVLYEEQLDERVLDAAIAAIADADVLIVGGTSLAVYPAASMIRYFAGEHLVLVNRDPTDYDRFADLIVREPIDEVLREAVGG